MSLLNEASFLVTPNGYKEDKLYAAIPTNGNGDMTFTRTGTATRVNEAGLIELVPYNLFARSEEFDNAYWFKVRSSITPNAVIAPDGTLTSDKLVEDTSTNNHYFWRYIGPVRSGGIKTFSVFVKKAERSVVRLECLGVSGFFGKFDLDTLTVTEAGGMYGGTSPSSTSIIPLANDWYRISISGVFNTSNSGQTGVGNVFLHNGTSENYLGDGTSGLYVWGAQVVEGSSALTYQKTVDGLDIPRIDYTGGGCPSILLEPQRTNIVLRSQEFDNNTSFQKIRSSISANNTTAPDGTLTADTWTGDGAAGSHSLAQPVSITSGVAYTQSVFAKKGTNNFLQIVGTISIYDADSWANFDLENGVVGSVGISAKATITDFGNGWYRCTMTATTTATALSNGFLLWLITSATSARVESTSLATSVHLWGAQVEAGAYPTSYIPTTTATVTRNADVINRDDIYTNNLITDEGGTWFVDLINNVVMPRDTSNLGLFIADSSDGITGNVISLRNNSSLSPKRLTINKRIAGSQTQIYITTTDHVKVAIKWNGTTADVFENGIKVVSVTSFTTTDMEFFNGTGADVSKYIKQMALFPTPLHDDECIALTTL